MRKLFYNVEIVAGEQIWLTWWLRNDFNGLFGQDIKNTQRCRYEKATKRFVKNLGVLFAMLHANGASVFVDRTGKNSSHTQVF